VTTAFTPDYADARRFAAALAGQYELEREIGRGGMGIVYLARDLKLDRRVAIKTLPPHLASDAVVRERFLREARTAGRLTHPNIVPIHRADELDGHVFFVMGFVEGDSLAQRIRELGRLDPREVLRELRDVAFALGFAHDHRIIHRDVKAENILIERATGRALVTDFGIARLAEAAPLTSTGQVLGTVYYLSPEQVSGDGVDARSDIYSLGVVGYLALSGRFPFDAELASAVLIAHVTKTAPPLHTVAADSPRALADVIDRCLAKDPHDRFQSAIDVVGALDAIAGIVESETKNRPASTAPLRPALVSDTEAQAIFGRAADLQAMTGVVPRPAPTPMQRDSAKDAARRSGLKLGDVRDAAVEAGIDARYVDHALEEHGLRRSAPPADRPLVVTDRSKPSWSAGAPTRIEFEVVVDGEMPDEDYDLIADSIRHTIGESGQMATVGRSFTWQTLPERRSVQVSVLSRGGKTTIRISENLKRAVGGFFGGIMGGVGGGTAGVWVAIAAKMGNVPLGLGLWGAAIATTYLTARGLFMITSNKRADELRGLAETLAAQARESIAAAKPRLPR
jgi:eukaryotic-like serine/threonine-protein kinase